MCEKVQGLKPHSITRLTALLRTEDEVSLLPRIYITLCVHKNNTTMLWTKQSHLFKVDPNLFEDN